MEFVVAEIKRSIDGLEGFEVDVFGYVRLTTKSPGTVDFSLTDLSFFAL